MANINDVSPSDISAVLIDQNTSVASGNILHVNPQDVQTQEQYNDEKYSTPGQQLLTVGEGLGQGFAGPVATAAEAGLSKLGVPGLSPEDQAQRAQANPAESIGSNIVGFGAGALTGTGEAALLTKLGEGAVGLAKVGEGASLISKVASTGVKVGTEMAALQAGDEISKAINQDPNQTLGSAAINIGLSGIIGGAGGAVLGSVSPLFKTAANKMGVSKLATDFMGETKFMQENPDMVQGATQELSGRMAEADNMRNVMAEAKPELIAQAMPEVTEKSQAKIEAQINDINSKLTSTIETAGNSVKTKAAVPYIAEDVTTWQNVVTNPNATFADKFLATNKLKQNLESYAKWGLTEEGSAKAALGRELSNYVRPMLEDSNVWGSAADIQKVTNNAVSEAINANKDLLSKVTSKLMGDREIDPNKLQTYFNQAAKGKAGLKSNVIRNYLDTTQKWADAINKVHIDHGLEAPINTQLNPTPILDHSLNTPLTPGRSLAQWAQNKGASTLANAAGETVAGGVGGVAGTLVGHPLVGAWVGEKLLSPVFSVLAKPFAEQAVNSEAMRSSVDFVANAVKGDMTLNNSVKALFQTGEIVPKYLMPDADSRKKLEKSLAHMDNPQNAMQVGGNIGHYMPAHGIAAASLAATAKNYLNSLKPKQVPASPFDSVPPVDKVQLAKYNRALDIAQQPLLILKYAKEGTLLPQDVQTIQAIYPGLHSALVNKLNSAMIEQKSAGKSIPYAQRVSLSMLMGSTPLDSTMTPQNMQAVMHSAGMQQQAQQVAQASRRSGKPSSATLNQINKVNSLYQTPLEARAANKRD